MSRNCSSSGVSVADVGTTLAGVGLVEETGPEQRHLEPVDDVVGREGSAGGTHSYLQLDQLVDGGTDLAGQPADVLEPVSTALGRSIPAGTAARIRNNAICWRVTPSSGE